jgi:hypothetical protein
VAESSFMIELAGINPLLLLILRGGSEDPRQE